MLYPSLVNKYTNNNSITIINRIVISLFELKNDCAPSLIDEELGKEELGKELIIINNNEDYLF